MSETLSIPGLDEVIGPMPRDHAQWQVWRRSVMLLRERVHEQCLHDRDERRRQLQLCARSRDYFLCLFGFIYEPRADPGKATRAYIPYPRQIELGQTLDWCLGQTGTNADLLISKSRDVGASWYMVGDELWRWRFLPTYQGRLVSRNENLVDMYGNPDSLFYKLEFLLTRLPTWMLPVNFSMKKHRLRLRLINPQTGAAIIGESTSSQAGRGGRATCRKYDEAAFIRNFEGIWDAAGNSTDHRVAISTESLEEDDGFYNIENGKNNRATPCIFTFDWDDIPGHDNAWFMDMKKRLGEDAFQREVLRNAEAGLGAWVYPDARSKVAGDFPYVPGWPVYVAIDDGFDDDTAIHWIQHDIAGKRYRIIESYINSHKPIDFYGSIMRGVPEERFKRDYTERDYQLMAFTGQLWNDHGMPTAIYFGDHHGANSDLSTGQSPFMRLTANYGIYVGTNPQKRNFNDRQDAATLALRMTDFNNVPSVQHTLLAFQEYRRPKRKTTSEAVSELRGGVHSWASHPVTAFEYFAVNVMFNVMEPLKPRSAKRDPYGFGYRELGFIG